MDASLHSQARGSFRRRPILAGSGCSGKDRYPLRILEIARIAERAEKPPELRLSAPGLDGEARPPTPTGSALRDAAGLGSVFERLTSFEELAAAWDAVLARDILDQRLRRQAKEIGADLDVFLGRLSVELRTGLYKPGPLYPLKRERLGPLRGGLGVPVLWVPSLRDGIVERAVAAAVGPAAEALQSSSSFGARTGLGIDAVVGRLTRLRGEGCANVLLLEIEGCASGVDLDDALETLRRGVPCERTLDLLCLLGLPRFEGVRPGAEDRLRGVLEGSSLRPLLENLALTDVDDAMCDAGFAYLRHGAKIAMCAPGRSELVDGLALISELVRSRGLTINEDATAMTSFDEGFCHLGIDYSQDRPLEPSAEAAAPVHVVYVGRDGSRVHVAKERLIVDAPDGLPQMSIPRRMVSRIVLTGNVGLSAGARSWALYNDIDVLCLSRRGTYLGQLAGPRSTANAPAFPSTSWRSSAPCLWTAWFSGFFGPGVCARSTRARLTTALASGSPKTGRKRWSTGTRPLFSAASRALCRGSPARGAGTSTTARSCSAALSWSPATTGWACHGADGDRGLRRRKQPAPHAPGQLSARVGLPDAGVRLPAAVEQRGALGGLRAHRQAHQRDRRRRPRLPAVRGLLRARRGVRNGACPGRRRPVQRGVVSCILKAIVRPGPTFAGWARAGFPFHGRCFHRQFIVEILMGAVRLL